ncbi:phosphoglycolate phosphatase-like HAD superfamily hydrolase [Streptomyces sp. V4I23]|uniref:HAD family hydrolase n=1 Tax=Streptomyces sp. V4I23 TaxID=3042282 RepID=UPI00278641BB|nr:HAD family hydrolase [Streptomyces sp. V4I23]MDQ1009930.1 phosphoglycolate phosphatase-like HAD superfamily hydrolase [Streptomyces sp. V4I23]
MTDSHPTAVFALLATAKCVLFDFDGPICHLFSGHPSQQVAAELRDWIVRNVPGDVPVGADRSHDPLALLRATATRYPGSDLVTAMERQLTEHELRAVVAAEPAEGAGDLIRGLDGAGFRLAVTTNNSASAVRSYLDREGLTLHFGPHIHGRMPDPHLMKPHPNCLSQALETTGSTAAESLMIGDSAADYEAAAHLGVPFLGYASNERKRSELEEAGATEIVSSMAALLPVLGALETGGPAGGDKCAGSSESWSTSPTN